MVKTYAEAVAETDHAEGLARGTSWAQAVVGIVEELAGAFIDISNTRDHAEKGRALLLEVMNEALAAAIAEKFPNG